LLSSTRQQKFGLKKDASILVFVEKVKGNVGSSGKIYLIMPKHNKKLTFEL
jgi:hypothetical protein